MSGLSRYNKFIVAIIGVILIGLKDFAGFEVGVTADQIMSFAIPILTAIGVWAVPNTE